MKARASIAARVLAPTRQVKQGLLIALVALGVDQFSKWLMVAVVMDPPRIIPVTPFFNLVLGYNRGVSFGFLSGLGPAGPMVITALSLAVVIFLLVWLWRSTAVWDVIGIGMIVGGALGNILDRVRAGAVTDFLDFFVGQYRWPTFNLADTAIFIGVAVMLIGSFRGTEEDE